MKPKPKPPKRKAIPCWAVIGKGRVGNEWQFIFRSGQRADRFRQIYGGTVHRGKFVFERGKK